MPKSIPKEKRVNPVFEIMMDTNATLRGELYPSFAPNTVGNFIQLANSGFYDGLTFHRCIRDFIIQGGRPKTPLPYSIRGEFEFNGDKLNRLPHAYGSLSMERACHYDSAASQFFIVVTEDGREHRCLDGAYAVFGRVTEGMKTAVAIAQVETDEHDAPVQEQLIRRVRVETFGAAYPFETIVPPREPAARRVPNNDVDHKLTTKKEGL